MSAPSDTQAAALLDHLFPAMDGAFAVFAKRAHAEGADSNAIMAALMCWAISRHADVFAALSHGDRRICASMMDIIKQMVDAQYEGEFINAAQKHAQLDAAGATVQ
jgi:hypothetical protein